MKTPFLALLLSVSAFASPQRDALLGSYEGRGCRLEITGAAQGPTTVTYFTRPDASGLWIEKVDRELERQLRAGATTLVFHHDRQSLGDMTLHYEITLEGGKPARLRGTGWGWGGNSTYACDFSGR